MTIWQVIREKLVISHSRSWPSGATTPLTTLKSKVRVAAKALGRPARSTASAEVNLIVMVERFTGNRAGAFYACMMGRKKAKTYERGDDISAFSMKSEKFLPSLIGESNPRTSLMLVFENMSHIIRL